MWLKINRIKRTSNTAEMKQTSRAVDIPSVLSEEGTDSRPQLIIHDTQGQHPFERIDLSHLPAQQYKIYAMSALLIAPLRLFLLILTLFAYGCYLQFMDIMDRYFGFSNLKKIFNTGIVPNGSRFVLYTCAIHHIERYFVTQDMVNEYRTQVLGDDINTTLSQYSKKDPYIVVSNHVAFQDPAVLFHELGECTFVVKQACESWPIIGNLLRQLNALLLVKARSPERSKTELITTIALIKKLN
jgi:hypothetical protein